MRLTAEERILYGQACWETFQGQHKIRRFGMSPTEYHLVRKWMDAGIPLMIAERGITETGGKPRTIMACEQSVERAYAYYRQAMGLIGEAMTLPGGTEDLA